MPKWCICYTDILIYLASGDIFVILWNTRPRARGSIPWRVKFLNVSKISRPSLDPPSLPLNGWKISVSPRARLPELEASHSPPSNTEIKNKKSYTSAVPIRLLGMCSKNFTYKYFKTNNCETAEVWSVLRDDAVWFCMCYNPKIRSADSSFSDISFYLNACRLLQ